MSRLDTLGDVAERQRAENFRESAKLLQLVLDNIPQCIFWKDRNSVYLGCNRKWAEMAEIGEPENAIGMTDDELSWSQEEIDWSLKCDRQVVETGMPMLGIVETQQQPDGRQSWRETNKIPIRDEEGNVIGILGTIEDITERKLAEELLKHSEAQARKLAQREALLNRLGNQIRNTLDLDTILETTVQQIHSLLQIDRCHFIWYTSHQDEPYWQVTNESRNPDLPDLRGLYPASVVGPLAESYLKLETLRVDDVDKVEDVTWRQFVSSLGMKSVLVLPIQTRSGSIGVISCTHTRETRPWSDSEVELLQAVTDQLAIAINQAELYAQTCASAQQARSQAEQLEQTLQELQKAQTQLIQTEKMSSLGQLVAGIAHEINNPVNFIYGNLTHAGQYIEDLLDLLNLYEEHYTQTIPAIEAKAEEIDLDFLVEDLPKILSSMKIGADRIRQIVISLRNFSRLDEAEMKPVDIHEGIDSTLLILQNRLKPKVGQAKIEVIKEYASLPLVECYAGQLNQVFMNVLTNAIDALESHASSLSNSEADLNQVIIRTELLADNSRVAIRIRDNGPGIPSEMRSRLFDPFFTTKPVGKGTGLGLSISYQIVVDKHGGNLKCLSEPGQGTEFWIEIPIRQRDLH